MMIYLMARAKSGVSILGAAADAEISYKTAWLMAHKIRSAMAEEDEGRLLKGIVEVDESYFGGKHKPGKRGRGAAGKTQVLIAVEVNRGFPGAAKMHVLPSGTAEDLRKACGMMIVSGSSVITDGLHAYEKALVDYTRVKRTFIQPNTAARKLPWVHTAAGTLKKNLLGSQHGVTPKNLQRYLSEFCWRFSRRTREEDPFDLLLEACLKGSVLTWAALARGPGP